MGAIYDQGLRMQKLHTATSELIQQNALARAPALERTAPRSHGGDGRAGPTHGETAHQNHGCRRPRWTVSASLRSIPDPRFAGLSNCWVARTERSSVRRPDTGERLVVETMRKLLARGTAPPLHPDAERDLMKARGLESRIVKADAAGDMDPPTSLTSSDFTVPGGGEVSFDYGLARGDYSSSDLVKMTESNREREFVEWVAGEAPASLRWLTPQPALDLLVAAAEGTRGLGGPGRPAAMRFPVLAARSATGGVRGGRRTARGAEGGGSQPRPAASQHRDRNHSGSRH